MTLSGIFGFLTESKKVNRGRRLRPVARPPIKMPRLEDSKGVIIRSRSLRKPLRGLSLRPHRPHRRSTLWRPGSRGGSGRPPGVEKSIEDSAGGGRGVVPAQLAAKLCPRRPRGGARRHAAEDDELESILDEARRVLHEWMLPVLRHPSSGLGAGLRDLEDIFRGMISGGRFPHFVPSRFLTRSFVCCRLCTLPRSPTLLKAIVRRDEALAEKEAK
ncbi:hypothetical protein Nepgr_008880 [Nepenthes gracilis]|uniref:Uncharacterized protein n=1 Tax=Nepenthes gracilis TaxID=150966 RepID=A0AAD3S9H1_NEPGR|nr:hypothetical protein Nepgr_008880 [Nepenthes gracilis]